MNTEPRLRCLVADDHPGLATAVAALLGEGGYDIVGPVGDGRRAVFAAAEELPDLAVVDVRMPHVGGVELVRKLREVAPEMRIVLYTADADQALVGQALEAGASALVLKESPLSDLCRALEAVLVGRPYVDPGLARLMIGPGARQAAPTGRELEVLRFVADGLSHEEIGARLEISAETVRTHVRNACDRLNATTRTQAVATALRRGLIA